MKFEIIEDKNKWEEIYNSTPYFQGKVYFSPYYCKALENNLEGKAVLCYFEDEYNKEKYRVLYPFIVKEISDELTKSLCEKPLFDIESPYGYGGPMIFTSEGYLYNDEKDNDNNYAKSFSNEFLNWAKNNNIVAEFVRFNPITMNHNLFVSHYSTELNRRTISINTTNDFNTMLTKATSARKRNYYKALNNGVEIVWCKLDDEEAMLCFRDLYDSTMNRLDADKYYYFSDAYFKTLSEIPDQGLIGIALYNKEIPIAASLFLFDEISAHYHLGGSDYDYKDLQGPAFLLWEGSKAAHEMGLETLHLGGGLSLDEKDKLFAFKKGFSSIINEFYIGKRIIKQDYYTAISEKWQSVTGKQPQIFLHYHEI